MTDTKPEALRLAEEGMQMHTPNSPEYIISKELRRLHEVNAELLEALKQLELVARDDDVWLIMRANIKNQVGAGSIRLTGVYADEMQMRFEIINTAIAKAEGESK
jgi:hypothetical protein